MRRGRGWDDGEREDLRRSGIALREAARSGRLSPGTHNSYAASDEPGWHFAGQRHGIGRQLDDGIRALLLDVHHGIAEPDGLVRTDFAAEGADANKVAAAAPTRARRVAERIAAAFRAARCS